MAFVKLPPDLSASRLTSFQDTYFHISSKNDLIKKQFDQDSQVSVA